MAHPVYVLRTFVPSCVYRSNQSERERGGGRKSKVKVEEFKKKKEKKSGHVVFRATVKANRREREPERKAEDIVGW